MTVSRSFLVIAVFLAACSASPPSITNEPPGENCPAGGVRVTSGDGDRFICHGRGGADGRGGEQGEPGAQGERGDPGEQGERGNDGQNGKNGENVTIVALEPGDACPYGGVTITSGSETSVLCSGADGSLLQVDAGATVTVREDAAEVVLDGGALGATNLLWEQLGGPAVSIVDPTAARTTFAPPDVTADTVLLFRLTATNGPVVEWDDVVVHVEFVNAPPSILLSEMHSVAANAPAFLAAVVSDPDGEPLDVSWTQLAGPEIELVGSSGPVLQFVAPESGELVFEVSASDGHVTTTAQTTVNVRSERRVSAGPDRVAIRGSEEVLTATVSGFEPVSVLWFQSSGEAVELSDTASLTPSFRVPDDQSARALAFRVTVYDGSTVHSDDVTLLLNSAPTAAPPLRRAVQLGESISMQPTFVDADGDPLTLSADTLPSWASLDESALEISGTPTNIGPTDSFSVHAQDPFGAVGSASFRARVFDVSFTAGPDLSFALSDKAPTAIVTGDFDLDGRIDLAVASGDSATDSGSVIVRLNSGAIGELAFGAEAVFALSQRPAALVTADVDGDGRLDLVTIGAKSFEVLLNRTAPGDTVPDFVVDVHGTWAAGVDLEAFDFNADGQVELVGGTEFWGLRNRGLPGEALDFDGGRFPGENARSYTRADFDGNGREDVAYTQGGDERGKLRLFRNAALPGAGLSGWFSTISVGDDLSLERVVAADLDGDYASDLVAVDDSGGVHLLRNPHTPGAAWGPWPQAVPAVLPLAFQATDVKAVDLTNDGLPDLVVVDAHANAYAILVNRSEPGAFDFVPIDGFFSNAAPHAMAIADFDRDGLPDLAFAEYSDLGRVSLHRNTTRLGISPARDEPVFGPPVAVARFENASTWPGRTPVCDVDGDGRPDLVLSADFMVKVLFNRTPPGQYTPVFAEPLSLPLPDGKFASGLSCRDLDLDGHPELIASTGSNTWVLRNTTTPGHAPSFGTPVSFFPGGYQNGAADFDGDGRPDLIPALSYFFSDVEVLQATWVPGGALSYGPPLRLSHPNTTGHPQTPDLNGDGRPDLVILAEGAGKAWIHFNVTPQGGTIAFAPLQEIDVGEALAGRLVVDLDRDGRSEIVVAGGSGIRVHRNETAPGPPDTAVAVFSDPIVLEGSDVAAGRPLYSYGGSMDAADVDGDGWIDLIASWYVVESGVLVWTQQLYWNAGESGDGLSFRTPLVLPGIDGNVRVADLNGDRRAELVTFDDERLIVRINRSP